MGIKPYWLLSKAKHKSLIVYVAHKLFVKTWTTEPNDLPGIVGVLTPKRCPNPRANKNTLKNHGRFNFYKYRLHGYPFPLKACVKRKNKYQIRETSVKNDNGE